MFKKKSLLFVNPDYHNCFLYSQELRKIGWRVDIYKQKNYPHKLLYSKDYFTDEHLDYNASSTLGAYFKVLRKCIFFVTKILKYKYYVVYGSPYVYNCVPGRIQKMFEKYTSNLELLILKLLGKKIIYFPSGCLEESLQADIKRDYPNLCANCGLANGACNDKWNKFSLDLRNKSSSLAIAMHPPTSDRQKNLVLFKYKSLDLDLWNPNIEIPLEFQLPKTENLRILHSFFDKGRLHDGKNIKGSPYIVEAIERLRQEGYPIEYYYVNSVHTKDMRFYQIQADIVVEQLIYGWWGSTGAETMALGKPVVCYLNPSWKERFFKTFPEYQELPIIEADTTTIYTALKKLVEDEVYRKERGRASRTFAEKHFDIRKNAKNFGDMLLAL